MAIVIRKNNAQQEGVCIKPNTQPIEHRYGTECEQNRNNFPGYPYSGYHRHTPSEYLLGKGGSPYSRQVDKDGKLLSCGIDWYDRLLQRHEMLLRVTGEPVLLYRRKWTGERCPCVQPKSNQARGRCQICYGSGFVGGFVRHINLREPDGRIYVRVPPTEEDLELQDSGLFQKFQCRSWTLPAPIIRDRDIIIRFNPDTGEETWRYEVLKVNRSVGFLEEEHDKNLIWRD